MSDTPSLFSDPADDPRDDPGTAPADAAESSPPPHRDLADPNADIPHLADTYVEPERGPSPFIEGLNPDQLDAVVHAEGPLLVVAGAGSGKTRVLTHRIAHLIDQGARPSEILAITFTNKAAAEMRERVGHAGRPGRASDVGVDVPLGVRAHPASRRRGDRLPAHLLDLRPGRRRPPHRLRHPRPRSRRQALHATRRARPDLALEERAEVDPSSVAAEANNIFDRKHADVYAEYQARLLKAGAMDFDDLLAQRRPAVPRAPRRPRPLPPALPATSSSTSTRTRTRPRTRSS